MNQHVLLLRNKFLTLLSVSSLACFSASAQTPVTSSRLDTVTAATGNTYTASRAPGANSGSLSNAGNYAYSFGNAAGFTDNSKILRAFTAGGSGYTYNTGIPITIKIRRVENAAMTDYRTNNGISSSVPVPTPRDLAYFEGLADNAGGTVRIKSPYIPKMEDLFATNDITIGIDNLFSNTPTTNFNNIERIDIVAPGGVNVPVPATQGFALFERGAYNGHDPAKVALITSIDGSGNPLTYAPVVVQILGPDYTFTGQTTNAVYQPSNTAAGNFIVMRRDDQTNNLQASDLIGGGQGIGGTLIKFSDFGIAANTTVYGYSVLANDFPTAGTGANVVDFTNTTYFPTNSSDVTGVAGNDMATVTGVVKLLTVSGNVFNDGNGLKDGVVNGTNINNPSGVQLYVNLVNASGIVVGVAPVQSDGSFVVDKLEFGALTSRVSTVAGTIGSAAPAASLPAGWANTGEAFGINNNSGTGTESPALANGTVGLNIGDVSITAIKFGIDSLPKADPKNAPAQFNPGGTTRVPVPVLTGSDREDGSFNGVSLTNTIVINTLAANGTLYYNGVAVTVGQVIPNYNPALLTADPVNGLVTVTFTYSQVDAAGLAGAPATVNIPFTSVVPVKLIAFNAQKSNSGKEALLSWISTAEQNVAYYEIERSINRAPFTSVGHAAALNTGLQQSYSFTDAAPGYGQNQYRLRITDADGTSQLSDIKVVNFAGKYVTLLAPNPAADYTILNGADKGMKASVVNAEGQTVALYTVTGNSFTIPLSKLAAGNYFIRVSDKTGTIVSEQQLIKY